MGCFFHLHKGKSRSLRAGLFLIIFGLFSSCQPDHEAPEDRAWQQAVDWLWSQQAPDGGWHSKHHGMMRGGQAHTPFILFALLQVPDSIYQADPQKVAAGLAFIRRHLHESGALGMANPGVMEYPNYATSYALRVLKTWGSLPDSQFVGRMKQYLVDQQFDHSRGIDREAPWFGAFGFGEVGLASGQIGHIDISHTRKVLEALEIAGAPDSVFSAARAFLRVMQKRPGYGRHLAVTRQKINWNRMTSDGGFFSSPNVAGANKANVDIRHPDASCYRSYATATCDGVLALLAAGHPSSSSEVLAAKQWLEAHPGLRWAGGIPTDDPAQWQRVLVFYHWWVRTEVNLRLQITGDWPQQITGFLLQMQQSDGSYANPEGARNKEDDPLLATAMAVMTWKNIRGASGLIDTIEASSTSPLLGESPDIQSPHQL